VEDLADLFRATLVDVERPVSLAQELELVAALPAHRTIAPGRALACGMGAAGSAVAGAGAGLAVAATGENAIYHGIEPLPEAVAFRIHGRCEGDMISLSVSNRCRPQDVPCVTMEIAWRWTTSVSASPTPTRARQSEGHAGRRPVSR